MDSLRWHELCAQLRADEKVGAPCDVKGLNGPEVSAYAGQVHRSLLRAPAVSPIHAEVAAGLVESWDLVQAQPLGARTAIALSADFGLGKSKLATAFARDLYFEAVEDQLRDLRPGRLPSRRFCLDGSRRVDADADYVPVLYLNLQSDTASKDLYAQVLSFLGHGTHATRGELASRAAGALATHGVQLLVVDDAHMLRTHLRQGRATLDALKHLATELGSLGGGMLLVGAFAQHPDVVLDPQLRARVRIHHFGAYEVETVSGRQAWQRLLKNWEERLLPYLPDLQPGLLSQRSAGALFEHTQGFVGDVAVCLADATRGALQESSRTLDTAALRRGRISQRGADGKPMVPARRPATLPAQSRSRHVS